MTEDQPTRRTPPRDRLTPLLGWGFVVTLLAGEAVLSLPDESDTAARVAEFYTDHRGFIIALQVCGFVSAALLAAFCLRLRPVDRVVAWAGVGVAVVAVSPGLVTLLLAIRADPSHPDWSGRLNQFLPRTDDVLFVAITVFALLVAMRLRRIVSWLAWVGGAVALLCAARLVLEVVDIDSAVDPLAPISFLVLVAVLASMALRRRAAGDSGVVGSQPVPMT